MISAVIGLPGGGKTMFCVYKLIEELVFTDRYIITNIEELNLPRLNEYIQQKYPLQVINLDARLRIIAKQETFRFYRYRAGGLVLPEIQPKKESRESFLEGMTSYFLPIADKLEWQVPVTYILSEAHEYFNARDWVDIGRPVLYYISKHRHLHDEIVIETQAPEMLESTFKRLVAVTHRLMNQYTMSFGPFRRPGCFLRQDYYQLPSQGQTPFATTTFKLDSAGIGSCYNTTGALGVMNRGPESKSHSKKRMPFYMIYVFGACVAAAIGVLMWSFPHYAQKYLEGFVGGLQKSVSKGMKPKAPSAKEVLDKDETWSDYVKGQPDSDDRLRVTGIVVWAHKIMVMLSDGRIVDQSDRKLERVSEEGVVYAGKKLEFARIRNLPVTPPAPGESRSGARLPVASIK